MNIHTLVMAGIGGLTIGIASHLAGLPIYVGGLFAFIWGLLVGLLTINRDN